MICFGLDYDLIGDFEDEIDGFPARMYRGIVHTARN